jgi:hypothetical protein
LIHVAEKQANGPQKRASFWRPAASKLLLGARATPEIPTIFDDFCRSSAPA